MAAVLQYAAWNSQPLEFSLDSVDDMAMTLRAGCQAWSFIAVYAPS